MKYIILSSFLFLSFTSFAMTCGNGHSGNANNGHGGNANNSALGQIVECNIGGNRIEHIPKLICERYKSKI